MPVHRHFRSAFTLSGGKFPHFPLSGRTLGVQRKQSPLGRQQIRQPEEGVQPRRVLRQSTVGHLLHAKEVLDDLERMFNLGPDATAAKIAISHDPAIIYKPGDGVVSSGLAYVAVRACQAVVC